MRDLKKDEAESRRAARRGVRMAGASAVASGGRLESTLRQRLRSVIIIVCGATLIGLVRGLATGDRTWFALTMAMLASFAGLAVLLSSNKRGSLRQLRALEVGFIFLLLAYVIGRNLAMVKSTFEAAGGATEELGVAPMLASVRMSFTCLLLMAVKGLILPGSWKRSALICAPIALAALSFPSLLRHELALDPTQFVRLGSFDQHLEIAFQMAVGYLIAVYGSHSIQVLRREAAAGRVVGQYELLRMVGEGGMGQVWLARHGLLARPAAIKLISASQLSMPGESAGTALSRFEQEARATAQLRSPHTIQIFDFGSTDDGSFYYAMEYLEGLDLGTLVADHGPIAEDRTISILIQACESLAEAHAAGMVHRDIKPQNIFLCRLGLVVDFVKVLDFGLVKIKGDGLDLSQGDIVGTPAFLPPEMGRGEAVDGRTDVYALACVAYWLLTGRFVFNAKTGIEMAMAHLQNVPGRPSSVSDEPISEAMDRLLIDCLAKDPIARPSGAVEFAERLRAIDTGTWTQAKARAWWDLHQPRD